MKTEVHQLRVNVKSLAAEARFIREEMKRATTAEARNALSIHRMVRLKPEARLAHLALAFVRGVPYSVVENHAASAPVIASLHAKIKRFVWDVAEKQVKQWLMA